MGPQRLWRGSITDLDAIPELSMTRGGRHRQDRSRRCARCRDCVRLRAKIPPTPFRGDLNFLAMTKTFRLNASCSVEKGLSLLTEQKPRIGSGDGSRGARSSDKVKFSYVHPVSYCCQLTLLFLPAHSFSRNLNFMILPVAVLGSSPNSTDLGALK